MNVRTFGAGKYLPLDKVLNLGDVLEASSLQTCSEAQCNPHTGRTDCELIIADYDVYIWDLEPGEHPSNLYNTVQEVSASFRLPGMILVHHGRLNTCSSVKMVFSFTTVEFEIPQSLYLSDHLIDTH